MGCSRRVGWVAWLLAPVLLLACSEAPGGRVLLVGIDGAAPRLVTPLLESGRLPQLARLAQGGVYAPLRAHAPITSPRIWTSMATGLVPERHGILGFGYTDAGGARRLYTSAQRTGPALWNIASAAGRRVAVVNWWNTYPVEEIDGVLVSDHLLASDVRGRRGIAGSEDRTRGAIAWPSAWDARARERLRDDAPLTDLPDPFAERAAALRWAEPEQLSERYQNDADVVRIALEVEAETKPDLLMVFLPGIDRVSHVLWGTIEPVSAYDPPLPLTPELRTAGAAALRAYYVYTDALIGRLIERFDLARDLVLVVSDHGFEAGRRLVNLTGVHDGVAAADGVLFAHGPDVAPPRERRRRFSVNDITPTVLAWMGIPPAQDMDGRPLPILERAEPAYVSSYADLPIERAALEPSGAEDEIFEQLDALGYLERDASR